MQFHQYNISEAFENTQSSPKGLLPNEAETRLLTDGPNELIEKKKKSPIVLFLLQFKDFMILVLIAAAIISGIVGDLTDTIIIFVIVVLNAVVGFVQEYRAEKAMEALKKMASFQARVLRDGQTLSIPSAELVKGDLVLLEAGNVVPADLRLTETFSLRIDESALTGESVPSEKSEKTLAEEDLPLGDRINMAYKSTLVTNGRANAVVMATGMNTEIGAIARMLQQKESVSPLQKRMADFGKKLSYLILLICLLLFVTGWLRGEDPLKMLLLSISLAVAAIPEALPALITIALAQGASRLVKKNALIRKLPAVETLGSVNFICSDKTGTLTQNKMTVVQLENPPEGELKLEGFSALHLGMALNHDVLKDDKDELIGDPTETAMVRYMATENEADFVDKMQKQFPREAELPFDSERKCMTTVHPWQNGFLVISKGAIEAISEAALDGQPTAYFQEKAAKMAENGVRVIAFGIKIVDKIPEPFTVENVEKDLQLAGLCGMLDPAREEVSAAIIDCKMAGIKVVMITGDHPATASAIARQIGILTPKDLVLTGQELKALSLEDFEEKVERIRVYARVSPEQKLTIVNALQKKGHFVSMTGDGVNDAPSLKTANIGVAMGIMGTDVSKEAADMILLDDNFTTIVKAVKEGRRIYDNIRKFVKYIMTCNGAEIWTIFLAPIVGLPIPLLPIHILWINLVTDGLPGLALAGEKAEDNIMKRSPRPSNESLFAGGIGFHIGWVGLLMAGVCLGTQAWAINHGLHWQTMVFTVLSLTQLGHVMAIKSDHQFLYKQGIASNRPLLGAVLLTLLLQLAVIYLPIGNTLFKTEPLTFMELVICLGLSAIVFHAVEMEKWIKARIQKKQSAK